MKNRSSKKIYLLILIITVLSALFFFIRKKSGELQWICQTDYTEITFADGFYYYRSEADNFYLYRAAETGQYQQCIAKQAAKEIYVIEDWVYFTNLSEGSKLFRVRTSGGDPEMVCAEKISRFLPVKGQFYCLSYNEGRGKIFVCTTEGKTEMLFEGECHWISTDGERLYLSLKGTEENTQYRTVAMSRTGEIEEIYKTNMRNLIPTERYLYYSEGQQIVRFDKDTGKETGFQIPGSIGQEEVDFRYVVGGGKIYIVCLSQKASGATYKFFEYKINTETFEELCQETDLSGNITIWDRMSSLYLVHDKIFYKDFVTDGKGELWYMLDLFSGEPSMFEKMEEPVAVDTSLPGDFFYDEYREGFLDQDILYAEEKEHGDGNGMGTTIVLPKINENLPAAIYINSKIREDAQKFYEEQITYHENIKWDIEDGENRSDGLFRCDYAYAGKNYVSIVYRKVLWTSDGEYGTREYVTRLYSSETGEELQIDDLFDEKWEEVLLRFSYLIRKTELSYSLFLSDLPLVSGNYMRVYYCLTNVGVDIVFVEDMRTFKEYHFVIPYKELEDILVCP